MKVVLSITNLVQRFVECGISFEIKAQISHQLCAHSQSIVVWIVLKHFSCHGLTHPEI